MTFLASGAGSRANAADKVHEKTQRVEGEPWPIGSYSGIGIVHLPVSID